MIGDRGARGGEREPTARALEAAIDRPGGGRAAPGAARPHEPRKLGPAASTDHGSEPATGGAATRDEQVEEHIPPTVPPEDAHLCVESAATVALELESVDVALREPLTGPQAIVGVQ